MGGEIGHWVSYLWHTQEALSTAGGRDRPVCKALDITASLWHFRSPQTDRPTPALPAQHDGGGGAARGGNAVKAAGRQLHILPTLGAWCVRRRGDEKGRGGGFSHASSSSLTSLITSHGGEQVADKTSGTTQQYQEYQCQY